MPGMWNTPSSAGFSSLGFSRTNSRTPKTTMSSMTHMPVKATCTPVNVTVSASALAGANSAPSAVRLTMNAVPKDAPTWLVVALSALPCWTTLFSSEFTPQVLSGVTRNWMPMDMVV